MIFISLHCLFAGAELSSRISFVCIVPGELEWITNSDDFSRLIKAERRLKSLLRCRANINRPE